MTTPAGRPRADGLGTLRFDLVRGWMFDVDGCLLETALPGGEGGTAFAGAAELIQRLRHAGHRIVCCTNASGRPPAVYAEGLRRAGIEVSADEIITSGSAGAHAVATRHPGAAVLALGGDGIVEPLRAAGVAVVQPGAAPADVVLIGAKDTYTRSEVDAACQAVVAGAPLYVSVMTPWFHGGRGRTASVTSAVAAGIAWITGVRPEPLGKPSPLIAELIVQRLGVDPSAVVVVGDSLDAEVVLAADLGAQSVWVRSGAPAGPENGRPLPTPTAVVADVGELLRVLAPTLQEV